MKKHRTLALLLLCISFVVFFCARWYFAHSSSLLEIAKAQIFAFPLFVAALWSFNERSTLLLRWSFAFVVVIGLTAVGFAYSHRTIGSRTVLIAPLQNDSFATQTRITQDTFEEASRRIGGIAFTTTYDTVSSEQNAQALLAKNHHTDAVVWGDTRWLHITFADQAQSEQIGINGGGEWGKKFRKLQMVTGVPSIGVSYNPLRASATFISLVTASSEGALRAASELQAAWTTYAHRPYADLLLGNLHMHQAFQNSAYQYGDMDCAIRAYQKGWSRAKAKDNLELKNALLNNLAIATYIQGTVEHDKEARLRARTWLGSLSRQPKSVRRGSQRRDISKIALENVVELRSFVTKGHKGKKKLHG